MDEFLSRLADKINSAFKYNSNNTHKFNFEEQNKYMDLILKFLEQVSLESLGDFYKDLVKYDYTTNNKVNVKDEESLDRYLSLPDYIVNVFDLAPQRNPVCLNMNSWFEGAENDYDFGIMVEFVDEMEENVVSYYIFWGYNGFTQNVRYNIVKMNAMFKIMKLE